MWIGISGKAQTALATQREFAAPTSAPSRFHGQIANRLSIVRLPIHGDAACCQVHLVHIGGDERNQALLRFAVCALKGQRQRGLRPGGQQLAHLAQRHAFAVENGQPDQINPVVLALGRRGKG